MSTQLKVNKKYRSYLKAATKHGARLEKGTKHLKVFDGEDLVAVIAYGKGQYEGPGDMALLRKAWRQRGWVQ